MEQIANCFIASMLKYLTNLQYLGNIDSPTLNDLTWFMILKDLYNQADWFELHEINKVKIQKMIEKLVLLNPNLEKLQITPGQHSSNVNFSQTLYSWRTIQDINFNWIV